MRKLTEFWEAICGGAEKTEGILGIEVEGLKGVRVVNERCVKKTDSGEEKIKKSDWE
jgi:hypothetical protein